MVAEFDTFFIVNLPPKIQKITFFIAKKTHFIVKKNTFHSKKVPKNHIFIVKFIVFIAKHPQKPHFCGYFGPNRPHIRAFWHFAGMVAEFVVDPGIGAAGGAVAVLIGFFWGGFRGFFIGKWVFLGIVRGF
jgi:hypothetical protein